MDAALLKRVVGVDPQIAHRGFRILMDAASLRRIVAQVRDEQSAHAFPDVIDTA